MVEASMKRYDINPLARFLHTTFDPLVGSETVDEVMRLYRLGTSRRYGGSAVFWQIDIGGRPHTGQIMAYDEATGKRIHGRQTWVHSVVGSDEFTLDQSYYGSHLASGNDLPIYLFESPKAALIMAIALRWCSTTFHPIAMATFGCSGFRPTPGSLSSPYDKHQVLRGRTVVLFPDRGKFSEWSERAKALKGFCKEVWVSTSMEPDIHPYPIACERSEGDGFDDLILRYMADGLDIADLIATAYGYHGQYKVAGQSDE